MGQVTDFRQTYTERKGLGTEIPRCVQAAYFWPSADWDGTRKVTMEFRYVWLGSVGASCPVKPPNRTVTANVNICCARADREPLSGG